MSKRRRITVYKTAPAPASPPAAAAPTPWPALGELLLISLAVVGLATAVRWLDRSNRLDPGVVCTDATYTSHSNRWHDHFCEPAPGFHFERLPGERVIVRDVRRWE